MQSMEEIYQLYAMTVYRYLFSLVHDPDLAEELTQETFCQAIRTVDRFDESCKLSTWLCAIAKNVLRTHHRKHPPTESIEDIPLKVPSAEYEVLSSDSRLYFLRRLHDLPEPYREIVYLRSFGNLSFREIGELLGKTENWARVTFYRAKERLRKEENHE